MADMKSHTGGSRTAPTIALLLALVALLLAACGGGGGGTVPSPNPGAGLDPQTLVVKKAFTTGAAPNRMVVYGKFGYVANYSDNNVEIIDLDSMTESARFALPVNSGPSEVEVVAGIGYAVCNGNNTLAFFNPTTGEQKYPTLDISYGGAMFQGPGQMAVSGSKAYIPNANVTSYAPFDYAPGSVTVVNLTTRTVTGHIATTFFQPLFAISYGGLVYVVEAGKTGFDASFNVTVATDGGIDVIDPATDAIVGNIDLGKSAAGRPAVVAGTPFAYVGTSMGGFIMKVNLDAKTVVRGVDDPIRLTSARTFISSLAATPDGHLLATSFNTDEVYVIDTATDAVAGPPFSCPFSLKVSADLVGGAADIAIRDMQAFPGGGPNVFILNGVANSLSTINLRGYLGFPH